MPKINKKDALLLTSAAMAVLLFAALFVFLVLMPAHAEEKNVALEQAKADLTKTFPKFQVTSFKESNIPGLYELVVGGQIIYFSPQGFLFFGEIWSKDGKSITADRRAEIMSDKISHLPLDKAVKIGSGKNTVIEFSDPDCPFCRKASGFFDQRNDVTRYVFLFPLTQIHPDAEKKAKYILCSEDRAKAYKEVMSGALDKKEFSVSSGCKDSLTQEHIAIGTAMGVRGTPVFYVNKKYVSGANTDLIQKYLNGGSKNE